MKDVWGFSFLGWIPDGHVAGIPDTEHEGPRGSVSPHDGNSMSRVASQHKREHLFGIPCVPICQTSWISCLQTTERSFQKQKQVLGTVFSILYQPSVTLREVLIKEGSQRKLPRCDSGASTGPPTWWHCWLVSPGAMSLADLHQSVWAYTPGVHKRQMGLISLGYRVYLDVEGL